MRATFCFLTQIFLIVSGCAPSLIASKKYTGFFSTCADVSCSRNHRCSLPRKLEHLWTKSVGYLDPSEPVIVNNIVIVSVPTKRILGFNLHDGSFVGELWTDASMKFPPNVRDSLLFYTGNSTWNSVGAYNFKRGNKLWSRDAGIAFIPPFPVDTFLIFLTAKGNIYCMNTFTGKTIWKSEFSAPLNVSPISDGAYIWFVSGRYIFKVNISDGKIVAKTPFHKPIFSMAKMTTGILVQTEYGISLLLDDSLVWMSNFPERVSGMCVRNDSVLVCAMNEANLIYEGDVLWSRKLGIGPLLAPVACNDGFVVSSISGKVAVLDFCGNIVDQYDIGKPIRYPPAISDGIIIVPTQNGDLVAVGEMKGARR